MKKSLIYSLILLCFISNAQAQPAYDSVEVAIKNFMAKEHVPGFAAALVKDGKLRWALAYGQADMANNKAMSIDGIMNIGSVSKTFTTTAAMQLWEKGLIDLEADVSSYVGFKVRN